MLGIFHESPLQMFAIVFQDLSMVAPFLKVVEATLIRLKDLPHHQLPKHIYDCNIGIL